MEPVLAGRLACGALDPRKFRKQIEEEQAARDRRAQAAHEEGLVQIEKERQRVRRAQ